MSTKLSVVLLFVLVSCSTATTGATTTNSTAITTTTVPTTNCYQPGLDTTVAYAAIADVDANLTSLDIYTPTSALCNAPIVMWVHGGGYAIGDKHGQIANKVSLFNDAGWILVSVNYRLTVAGLSTSAQFSDHYDDVAAAVSWVHDNIGDYGGDPTRIALLGHSAGADIVSNIVTNPTYLERVGLGLEVIRCAGPLDTEGFDKAEAASNDPDGERAQWSNALGNNPDYIAATSATLLIEPGIGIPPMIGVVRGTRQRQQIETDFLETLTAAGIEAVMIDARSLTHMEVNSRIGAPNDLVMTAPLMQFLTKCLT
ncbi:hypothetical protein BH10ACT2_BH10ACT2_14510 [soil metagenome]